jgi:hypothetical protein
VRFLLVIGQRADTENTNCAIGIVDRPELAALPRRFLRAIVIRLAAILAVITAAKADEFDNDDRIPLAGSEVPVQARERPPPPSNDGRWSKHLS